MNIDEAFPFPDKSFPPTPPPLPAKILGITGREVVAGFLRALFVVVWLAVGLIGLAWAYKVVADLAGGIIAAISLLFFPLALAVAPWIHAISSGDWTMLLFVYGGGLVANLLRWAAERLE